MRAAVSATHFSLDRSGHHWEPAGLRVCHFSLQVVVRLVQDLQKSSKLRKLRVHIRSRYVENGRFRGDVLWQQLNLCLDRMDWIDKVKIRSYTEGFTFLRSASCIHIYLLCARYCAGLQPQSLPGARTAPDLTTIRSQAGDRQLTLN